MCRVRHNIVKHNFVNLAVFGEILLNILCIYCMLYYILCIVTICMCVASFVEFKWILLALSYVELIVSCWLDISEGLMVVNGWSCDAFSMQCDHCRLVWHKQTQTLFRDGTEVDAAVDVGLFDCYIIETAHYTDNLP